MLHDHRALRHLRRKLRGAATEPAPAVPTLAELIERIDAALAGRRGPPGES